MSLSNFQTETGNRNRNEFCTLYKLFVTNVDEKKFGNFWKETNDIVVMKNN